MDIFVVWQAGSGRKGLDILDVMPIVDSILEQDDKVNK
jgi:hypothetical protein